MVISRNSVCYKGEKQERNTYLPHENDHQLAEDAISVFLIFAPENTTARNGYDSRVKLLLLCVALMMMRMVRLKNRSSHRDPLGCFAACRVDFYGLLGLRVSAIKLA